jgi:hexosaminidase
VPLPLVPAAQHSALTEVATTPLTATHIQTLADALRSWAPRAAAATQSIATDPDAPTPTNPIVVHAERNPSLPSEGYKLRLMPTEWTLHAADEAGAFWAVQTLRQILRGGDVPQVEISDNPKYAVRGFMLDIARFFFDPDEIKKVIDIAASYKFNQFHLHLTDDQGWRIEIEDLPLLTELASGHDVGGGTGGFLTIAEFEDLQKYALDRHIIVLPEIDLPGHSHAAQIAYPQISPDGAIREPYIGTEVGFSSVHLTSEESWNWADDVVASVAKHTLGDYLHLGGDESLTLERKDYLAYMERLAKVAERHGKKVVFWQEAAGAPLPPKTRLQYWTWQLKTDHMAHVAREQDVTFVASPANKAYLDQKYTSDSELGLDWAALIDVKDAYGWEPLDELPNIPATSIIGVEACLWSETLRTFDDLTMLLLPRLPAVASVAWGSPKDFDAFAAALAQHGPWWTEDGIAFYPSTQITWA